jgi:diaminohydroxyphosphoribosylaminopyrimidine deaminase / 5-amino-6-(5-phosphoribosylamino)uracil reductase
VGLGTIVADDPMLTDRTRLPRRRPLLRIILDSHLRLPLESNVVKTAKDDLLVFCCAPDESRKRELERRGVTIEVLPSAINAHADLHHLVRRIGEMEITSLLVEGGASVNWAALSAGVVDKVFLYYAPKILGGTGAVPFAGGEGFHHISEAAHVKDITIHRFAEDFAVEGYLRDPYAITEEQQPLRKAEKTPGGSDIYIGV